MQLDPWTLSLQTLNALVLVWLLTRFLYRPVTAIIAPCRAEAATVIAPERGAAQAELESSAADMALFIARRLLARLPPAVAAEAFLAALAADFAALPEPARRQFLDPGETVTVASAVPLEAAVQQACREMLAGAGEVAFATDPALIAGLELRAPHATLRANWQAELQHIAAALAGKDGAGKDGAGRDGGPATA